MLWRVPRRGPWAARNVDDASALRFWGAGRRLLLAGVVVIAAAVAAPTAVGVTATSTVSVTIASAIALTDQCQNAAGYSLGALLPGSTAETDTGGNVCRYSFSSSNDTAMLRVMQKDHDGTAFADAKGGWTTQQAWNGLALRDVEAYDASIAIAVGDNDSIFTTANGSTWTAQTCASCPWDLKGVAVSPAVAAPGAHVMWVSGGGGAIFKSTNSGVTWASQTSTTTQDLVDIVALSDLVAYAGGTNGKVLRTIDGGTTWAAQAICGGMNDIHSMSAVGPVGSETVWMTGTSGKTCVGTRSGAPTSYAAMTKPSGIEVDMYSTTGSWTLDQQTYGPVAYTTNGGATPWTTRPFELGGDTLNDVASLSASSAWYVGTRGTIVKTTDTGATFVRQSSSGGDDLTAIEAVDATHAFAIGDGRTIVGTSDGSNWTVQRTDAVPAEHDLNDIDAYSSQVAWAVGAQGTIRATTNGGTSWTNQPSGTGVGLRHVSVQGATNVWVVGDGGTILNTTNGGTSWTVRPSGTLLLLQGIAMADSTYGWVVGDQGTILRTTDGGATWSAQSASTTVDITSVAALTPLVAVATRSDGKIIRTADGGATWAIVYAGGGTLSAVDFATPNAGFVNGGSNVALKTIDGGVTWSVITGVGTEALDVAAVSGTYALFADSTGQFAFTTDQGATVSTDAAGPYGGWVNGLAAPSADTQWLVGVGGAIEQKTPAATFADYAAGANWGSAAATTNMFGACLQNVGGSTTAVWTRDITGVSGKCEANDTDPWNPIGTSAAKIARTTTPGATGSVDIVFGARAKTSQPPGTYIATVMFEALAPDV